MLSTFGKTSFISEKLKKFPKNRAKMADSTWKDSDRFAINISDDDDDER